MKHIWLLLLLIACGQNATYVSYLPPKDGTNGIGCLSQQTATGTLISCSNGNAFLPNGTNGENALINIINSAPSCSAGGITIISGTDVNFDGLITSVDYNVKTATICNGVAGQTGAQGLQGNPGVTPSFAAVSTIAPCTNASSPYKEQLLCLYNGSVLSSFSDTQAGYNTRLAFVTTGQFIDTDQSGCIFNVSVNNGSTTISWGAGSNAYASWSANSISCQVH